ncbi:HAUS augmin-like complex subunit 3 [Myiozetetes cayanensis]|uniref:HAUS augmin-like complex subunit 3 n=1 Tax=Myiozetetes cayanensis TaxID=478635 RepID=UPI00215FBBFF|nr:HAUS augmin-like complex subunit 3 [Myiozetetes cayanensis]XP_050193770.1 HAUS augmin-like complex subunit 3 [Myiozetetes cayanensis]XP_050193771.1 HAUS augmin-like complex subunit 3 [Myiozetetes cayanensis]XP_050193772.1 HAUS augmin-like complex subunit 3 [Myiozetetes cayanensis]XP_050193773.1 HAUS augmin-like complex subunit 3 [Myiozetetes cayanensis]
MSCGKDFVETLKKIGYPKADELNGEDFDWMFESLEDRSFLEWFCGNINEQHVVSEKELQDFDNLLECGKPILEGDALDEALKTLRPMDSKNSNQEEEEEEEELKELEDELQTLQQLKKLQIHHHNKLQLMVTANSHVLQTLQSKEEEAQKDLKEALEVFIAANKNLDSELQSLMDAAKKFASFFTASDSENPVFFSQLPLDKYFALEEQNTAALTSHIKNHFYQGMSECVENSHEDSFQLEDLSKRVTCEGTDEVSEESQEVARLQTAYICAQHQLIQLQAQEEGMKSAIKCAESMLQSLDKDIGQQENLDAKMSSLSDEISTIKRDIAQINSEELLPLLKEKAQLLTAPVLKAYLDHHIAQQDCYVARQDEMCRHLMRQKTSFELIELGCKMEMKKHQEISSQLENLVESLRKSTDELQQRLQAITERIQPAKPKDTISPEDGFACRLYQLLEGGNNKQQLFKTYKNLEQMAQKLKQDCATVQEQIAASSQEQSLLLSNLERDVDTLRASLYCGGNQIQLRSPELTELFHQLEVDINKLNQLLMDLVADLKLKKSILESNKLQQMERDLYVYFFKDEDHLKEMVENLEQQSQAKVSGLEDENFTANGVPNV